MKQPTNEVRSSRLLRVIGLIILLTAHYPAMAQTRGSLLTPTETVFQTTQPPLADVDGTIHVVYAHQLLEMRTDVIGDEAYVDMSDAGLVSFFNLHGVTIRWSDGPDRALSLFGGGHYLRWAIDKHHGFVDGDEVTRQAPLVIDRDGHSAISLRGLAQSLNFRLRPDGAPGTWRFVPRIEKIDLRRQEDREIVIHASGPLDHLQVSNSGQRTRVVISGAEWAFDERAFQFGDIGVDCGGSGTEGDPLTIAVHIPVQWKLEPTRRLFQNELGVRVVPDFQADISRKPETLANFRYFKGIGDLFVMFDVSGPAGRLWRYEANERLLTVDVPNATVGNPVQARPNAEVQRIEAEDMRTAAFPIARVRIFLKEGFGFEVVASESNHLTIRVAPLALLPISAMSGCDIAQPASVTAHVGRGFIVIDPGHGGSDPGAMNHSLGLCEKNITLDISLRLKAALEARGFHVVLTRDDDRDVSWAHSPDGIELGARVQVANHRNADLFLSIHCNSSGSSAPGGSSYHWFKPQDLPLARALAGSLVNGTGLSDHGMIRNRFFVLRRTNMPAVLVETAFISNPNDANRLADPAIRQKIANNLAEALAIHSTAVTGARRSSLSTARP